MSEPQENTYTNCYNFDNILAFHNVKVSQSPSTTQSPQDQNKVTNKIIQQGNSLILQLSLTLNQETIHFENHLEFHSQQNLDSYLLPNHRSNSRQPYQKKQQETEHYLPQSQSQSQSRDQSRKKTHKILPSSQPLNYDQPQPQSQPLVLEDESSTLSNHHQLIQQQQEEKQDQGQEMKSIQKSRNPYYGLQRSMDCETLDGSKLQLFGQNSSTTTCSSNSSYQRKKAKNGSRKYSSFSNYQNTDFDQYDDDSSSFSSFGISNVKQLNIDELKEFGIFTNRKNAVKNIVKAFHRYLTSPVNERELMMEIEGEGASNYKLLRDLRKCMNRLERKRKYNQQLIYTIYTQNKLNTAFKTFLNNHSFKWLSDSKIQDQDIYFNVLKDYQNLFNQI